MLFVKPFSKIFSRRTTARGRGACVKRLFSVWPAGCLIFLSSCSSGEDLTKYREKTLKYLVQVRMNKNIAPHPEFEKKNLFELEGWHLMLFQRNTDRSQAVFKISGFEKSVICGLYIREKSKTELAVNLIECKGPGAGRLSGESEYGLPVLVVAKSDL